VNEVTNLRVENRAWRQSLKCFRSTVLGPANAQIPDRARPDRTGRKWPIRYSSATTRRLCHADAPWGTATSSRKCRQECFLVDRAPLIFARLKNVLVAAKTPKRCCEGASSSATLPVRVRRRVVWTPHASSAFSSCFSSQKRRYG